MATEPETPDYGPVWIPRTVTADWAPYQAGHWAWVAPWGWSWVGHEPGRSVPLWSLGASSWPLGMPWRTHRAAGLCAGHGRLVCRRPVSPFPSRSAATDVRGGFRCVRSMFPSTKAADYVRRVNRTHVNHIENLNVIVSNPHDFRPARYIHRDMPAPCRRAIYSFRAR